MTTLIAKLAQDLYKLCHTLDPRDGFHDDPIYIIWTAKKEALETAEKNGPESLSSPESWLTVGLNKVYNERPQDVSDMICSVLGWRLYQNIHDRSLWAWGYPPKCLGGEGSSWTWKAGKDNFGRVIEALIAKLIDKKLLCLKCETEIVLGKDTCWRCGHEYSKM